MRTTVLAALLAPLAAQTTHVVDALGSPGSFPTLPAALQVANAGDVITVLPTGVYDFGVTTNKGVTLVGVGTAPISFRGTLRLDGLAAGSQFAMRHFASSATASFGAFEVAQCSGNVVLEDLVLYGDGAAPDHSAGLLVIDCAAVSIGSSVCAGAVHAVIVMGSRFTANATVFYGDPTASPVGALGLRVLGSDAHLTNCIAAGAIGGVEAGSYYGVGSVLTFAGGGTSLSAPSGQFGVRVLSQSELRIDSSATIPIVQLEPGPFPPPAVLTNVEAGRVTSHFTPQNAAATFDGPAGDFGVLVFALPAPPVATPLGTLWCDLQTVFTTAIGGVPVQASLPIPPGVPPSVVLVSQGLLLHGGSFRLSGAVHSLVP